MRIPTGAALAVLLSAQGAAAQSPSVAIIPPAPLVHAEGTDGNGPSAEDTYAASLGGKAFGNVVAGTRDRLDATLLDYPSTRFREVRFGYRNADRIICGLYNTKNRMGAYGGWAIFYAFTSADGFHVRILDPGDPGEYSFRWHCGEQTAWLPEDRSEDLAYKP